MLQETDKEYMKEVFASNKNFAQSKIEAPWYCSNQAPTTRVEYHNIRNLVTYIEENKTGRYFYSHYHNSQEIWINFENPNDYSLLDYIKEAI